MTDPLPMLFCAPRMAPRLPACLPKQVWSSRLALLCGLRALCVEKTRDPQPQTESATMKSAP